MNSNRRGFASDNNSGVHPEILNALMEVNTGHAVGYGDDPWTKDAEALFSKIFEAPVNVFFVFNGTGANIVALQALCHSYEAVVTSSTAHIMVDECASPEKHIGGKLIGLPSSDGKISPSLIRPLLHAKGFEHHAQPKVISISQSTELGTLYSVDEIKTICDFAHQHQMFVHVDGARIANAIASSGSSLKKMLVDTGVDVISFGGTKNGLMFGEAVVCINRLLSSNLRYIRKQSSQLFSKMRFISAQYLTYLEQELWLDNARQANNMARYLATQLKEIPMVKISREVSSNAVFAILPNNVIESLKKKYFFYVWDQEISEVRWMTSFDTTENDIDVFIEELKDLILDLEDNC